MPNEEYSETYANERHEGKESEDNFKVLWEDEIELTGNYTEIKEEKSAVYELNGLKGDEPFAIDIPDMRIWKFIGEAENQIAVSVSIIEDARLDKENNLLEVRFKEKSVVSNVIPGIYIDVDSFPKELKS